LFCKLLIRDPLGWVTVWVLEVQVVLLDIFLVEFAGSDIHGDVDLASVSGRLDSLGDELESLLGSLDIWCNTTLVSDITRRLSILLLGKSLQLLVNLRTLTKGLGEAWCGSDTD
jgi:hypothetical protein